MTSEKFNSSFPRNTVHIGMIRSISHCNHCNYTLVKLTTEAGSTGEMTSMANLTYFAVKRQAVSDEELIIT